MFFLLNFLMPPKEGSEDLALIRGRAVGGAQVRAHRCFHNKIGGFT
jgi:hypothetical protein